MNPQAVKLASNENPLGPSPLAVKAAQRALAEANRYPEANGLELRQALAKKHCIPLEQVILGAGSTELIDLAARLLLLPTDAGITSYGSFPLYYMAIRAARARLIEVPLQDYRFDLDAIAATLDDDAKIVYLANPNNPTGTMFTADEFESFLTRVPDRVFVVIDEAYCEYIGRQDYSRSVEIVKNRSNLMVLRTFSKIYGLAGLRIGYGLGPAAMLEQLNKIRGPFTTSNIAQAAALAALGDLKHIRCSIETNNAGLKQLADGLKKLGVRCIPSVGNFILAEFGYDTESLGEKLSRRGILVRPMRWMGFPQAIRVSVGTRTDNGKFLNALADLLRQPAGAKPKRGRKVSKAK